MSQIVSTTGFVPESMHLVLWQVAGSQRLAVSAADSWSEAGRTAAGPAAGSLLKIGTLPDSTWDTQYKFPVCENDTMPIVDAMYAYC